MYDSTTARDIPRSARVVGGYVNGRYAWSKKDWARFPHATKIRIAVTAVNKGDVLDVEPGDATPGQVRHWIRMRQKAGIARPTIYVNRSTAPAVKRAARGLHYALWIADYTGKAHAVRGSVATQYADPAHGSGGHYDLSRVSDPTWHPASATTAKPSRRTATRAVHRRRGVITGHRATTHGTRTSVARSAAVARVHGVHGWVTDRASALARGTGRVVARATAVARAHGRHGWVVARAVAVARAVNGGRATARAVATAIARGHAVATAISEATGSGPAVRHHPTPKAHPRPKAHPKAHPKATPRTGIPARIVAAARRIASGHGPGWHRGRHVPYTWAGGHGRRPGPTWGVDGGEGSSRDAHIYGLDCSGFTRWVYALAYHRDVLGPGNTNAQLARLHRDAHRHVGDLVFFGSSRTDTEHVGVYIGHGRMINAPYTGVNVRTDPVRSGGHVVGYYRNPRAV